MSSLTHSNHQALSTLNRMASHDDPAIVPEPSLIDVAACQPVHSFNEEYQSALGEIEIPEEHLLRIDLPAGHQRMLHVSPKTIQYNDQHQSNYPTVIIKDDDGKEIGRYHGVVISGAVALRQKKEDGKPAVAIMTKASVTCFADKRQMQIIVEYDSCCSVYKEPRDPDAVGSGRPVD